MSRRRSDSTIVTPRCGNSTRVGADRGAMVVNDVSRPGSSRRGRRPGANRSAAGFAQDAQRLGERRHRLDVDALADALLQPPQVVGAHAIVPARRNDEDLRVAQPWR